MNVIIAYLETMFSTYPQTPRMLEAKAELQAMMEDAYANHISEGMSENEAVGKVITEFGNLDELAPVLGIATEIAPRQGSALGPDEAAAPRRKLPEITLDEAQDFAETRRRTQPRIAVAVALFIICPVPLLIGVMLSGNKQGGSLTGLGLIPLLALIAIGVTMIIAADQKRSAFKRIDGNRFSTSPAVTAWARDLESSHARRRSLALQIAVTLWILAAAPILLTALMFPNLGGEGNGATLGVIFTLLFVAAGILVFLPNSWASEAAEILTKQSDLLDGDEEEDEEDEEGSVFGVIAAIYWPLLTAIFLAWSFIGNAWDRSWIVWPIGAVLFGAIAAGAGAWSSYRKSKV